MPQQQASPSRDELSVIGMVDSVVFASAETGYGIMRLKVDESFVDQVDARLLNRKGQITIVGFGMAHIPTGEKLRVTGKLGKHSTYGYQLEVREFTLAQPRTLAEYEKFLVGHVREINKHYAHLIVQRFGFDTLDVIANQPERLREIKGIGDKRIEEIKRCWAEQNYERDMLMFCTQIGLPTRFKEKIRTRYKDAAIETIRNDPYALARDINGIGFKTADECARRLGISETSNIRIRAAAIHLLDTATMEGHCFAYAPELVSNTHKFLAHNMLGIEAVTSAINEGIASGLMIADDNRIYLPRMLEIEKNAAARLTSIMNAPPPPNLAGDRLDTAMRAAVSSSKVELDPVQYDGVRTALSHKVSYITGGPGTGKTTITKCVVAGFKAVGLEVTLVAPTGRAAKRMQEVVGLPAQTIHRELAMIMHSHAPHLSGAIVVDEASMIDVSLLAMMLKHTDNSAIIVFVGDVDQLPSVGPGAVLRDMIGCGKIPGTRLSKIFRQAAGSDIVVNAHAINRGSLDRINHLGRSRGVPVNTDMMVCLIEDVEQQLKAVVWLSTVFAQKYGFDCIRDTQVISPGHDGIVGVANLNTSLQKVMNPQPPDSFQRREGVTWGVGDRIMNTKNSYNLGVFNGDLGTIKTIDRDDKRQVTGITVEFDGRDVALPSSHFPNLQMAYASTVHKVQGSEFPLVIVVLHTSNYMLLQRNLLYTAVTRSRRMCVLVAHPTALGTALRNEKSSRRNTFFAERIGAIAPGGSL